MPEPLGALWGATLEQVDLDIVSQRFKINCRVEENGRATRHELEFRGISELRFFNSIRGPWDYAEITEIHTAKDAAGTVRAEMILWSENAGLVVVATSVELDGKSAFSADLPG
jgi:hypothetical protein